MTHLNENSIQAFLDGELSDGEMNFATLHLAQCERCTAVLLAAEAEQSEVNFAFAAEASSFVPSQRIWARIENEIDFLAVQKKPAKAAVKTFWQQMGAFFTPAQFAFAGGLAAVVLVSLLGLRVVVQQSDEPLSDKTMANVDAPNLSPLVEPVSDDGIIPTTPTNAASSLKVKPLKIVYRGKADNNQPIRVAPPKKIVKKNDAVLPQERDYLSSIAQLAKAVESSGESVMRPSFRVDYERNLAMMDGAIAAMQKQARRNPQDDNARRILFASYQNKIDLLNTVSEKSQLMASIR